MRIHKADPSAKQGAIGHERMKLSEICDFNLLETFQKIDHPRPFGG